MIVEVIIFLTFLLLFWYHNKTKKWNVFQSRGIPYAPGYFPFGSKHNWRVLFVDGVSVSDQYRSYLGSELEKEKLFGFYGHPDRDYCLVVNDLDIAKRMLIKDFNHFVDRTDFGLKFDEKEETDMIFQNMFIMQKGDPWKIHRSLMSPVFTTGKLKLMYPLLVKTSQQLEKFIENKSQEGKEIDSKETFFKFALDGIATAGFGIELDSFADPNSVFVKMVKEIQRASGSESGSTLEMTKLILAINFPILKLFMDLPNFSRKPMLFMRDIIRKTIEMRNGQKKKRNDIIDLVISQMENKNSEEKPAHEDEFEADADIDLSEVKNVSVDHEKMLVSNAFLLFIAALDTTSATLTFCMFFLLKYPDIQEKLRQEILEVVGDDENLTFDHIQSMKYMDNVLYETLRKSHPFAHILERECTQDYKIPGTDYVVRKGEVVNFSFLYERMKENNTSFANPDEFDPSNFEHNNNPDHFSFLGFGQGPRNCVGKRYAMITMKLALVPLLKNYRLVKTKNSPEELKLFKFLAGADVRFHAVPV